MPIKAQLVLPDNLRSTYLRSNFLDSGAVYNTNKPALTSALDANNHTIRLKFELLDTVNRESVSLQKIVSLEISNDPEFSTQSTIKIENWPSTGSYSSSTDYTLNLNSLYFFNSSSTIETSRTTAAGTGIYVINNWPLSATGGLSTVYVKALVQSTSGEQASYPEGYAIYDQISWEGELPSTPGRLIADTNKSGFTGAQSLFHFRSSSESSTGVYGSGVSSYIGDIFEISYDTGVLNLLTTRSNNTTGNFRSVISNVPGTNLPVTSYKINYLSTVYTSEALTLGTSITLNSSRRGAFFYGNNGFALVGSDLSVLSQSRINLTVSNAAAEYKIFAKLHYLDLASNPGSSQEIVCSITSIPNAYPVAKLYKIVNGTDSTENQTTNLPLHLRDLILQGGLFETYLSKTTDDQYIVEFYWTAADNQSYLLASSLIPEFTVDTVKCGYGASINAHDGTVTINEIALVKGNAYLNADLGDCKVDDKHPVNFPTVNVTNWATSVSVKNEWTLYSEPLIGSSSPITLSTGLTINKLNSSEIVEYQLNKPTMSSRAVVYTNIDHNSDTYYVVFSTDPTVNASDSTLLRPMITRCLPDYVPTHEPINTTTVGIFFDAKNSQVLLVERIYSNVSTSQVLCKYNPNNTDDYAIYITDEHPVGYKGQLNKSNADGTWIILKRNNEIKGSILLSNKIWTYKNGLGYYVATGFIGSSYGSGSSIANNFSIYGLPRLISDDSLNNSTIRHFLKSDTGSSQVKPWLGQFLLAGSTDFQGWDYKIPYTDLSSIFIKATTNGINVNILAAPSVIDGYTLSSGDLVLVKDQLDKYQNGIYKVINPGSGLNGSWVLDSSTVASRYQPYSILNGNVNGKTYWYLDYPDNYSNQEYYHYKSTVFTKKVTFGSLSSFYSAINPTLLEIKALWSSRALPSESINVKFRFFSNSNDEIGSSKTDWFTYDLAPLLTSGISAAYNDLIQKILSYGTYSVGAFLLDEVPVTNPENPLPTESRPLNITVNEKVWVAIRLPMGLTLGTANSNETTEPEVITTGDFAGWNLAPRLWFKVYSKAVLRERNKRDNLYLTGRVRALSHANISSSASILSDSLKVDITPPSFVNNKPVIEFVDQTTVRTATVRIKANDSSSGVLAFRFGKETDYGNVSYTPWQSWEQFDQTGNAQYVVYLYGSNPTNNFGVSETVTSNMNAGMIGARKIWAQVIDFMGNISESFPLTVFAQGQAIVDTTPPTGNANFYDTSNNLDLSYVKSLKSSVKFTANDRVSGIKDFRFRTVNSNGYSTWSNWNSYKNINNFSLSSGDGRKSLQFQLRDYGNNISLQENIWSKLYEASSRGIVFVSADSWQKTGVYSETLFFGGTKQTQYLNMSLIESTNGNFVARTAFYIKSNSTGRILSARTTDIIVINGTALSYVVDPSSGLIVFASAIPLGVQITCTVTRNSAVLYSWDDFVFKKALDLGHYGEICITSVKSYSDGLILGTSKGSVYLYDGSSKLSGPIFTAFDSIALPITSILIHQYLHESESYVYVSTDKKPRLYRSKLSEISSNASWLQVGNTGDLALSSGGAMSLISAFNKIFVGCRSSKMVRYERFINELGLESETVTSTSLINQNLGLSETLLPAVRTLAASDNQVLAGLDGRPEIYSYVETSVLNPSNVDKWMQVEFDEVFARDPYPAQYYFSSSTSYLGNSTQRSSSALSYSPIIDDNYIGSIRNYIALDTTSSSTALFSFDSGSDWEYLCNSIKPVYTNPYNARIATTELITLSGVQTVDGVLLSLGDRVLVKNQTNSNENGLYIVSASAWSRDSAFSTGASNVSAGWAINVDYGTRNTKSLWILQASTDYTFATGSFVFDKYKYSIDLDLQHASGTGKQALEISDGFYNYTLRYDSTKMYLENGTSTTEIPYYPTINGIEKSNIIKIWSFSNNNLEDTGPYWESTNATAINEDWFAGKYVVPVGDSKKAGTPVSSGNEQYLSVQLDSNFNYGNPFIFWSNTDLFSSDFTTQSLVTPKTMIVDETTRVKIKLRLVYNTPLLENAAEAKIRMYWSSHSKQDLNYCEVPLENKSARYYTYEFSPSWNGEVNYLAFEFANFEENLRPNNLFIDYVMIYDNDLPNSITQNPTSIRIGVENRDLKIWFGGNVNPVFSKVNCLVSKNSSQYIKLGKIDYSEAASKFIYGHLNFLYGESLSPSTKKIDDFHLTWRFPSTGGVQKLVHHLGTLYALTDGLVTTRLSDNPIDRMSKTFKYIAEKEIWVQEDGVVAREIINNDTKGMIRPLLAITHNNILVVSGQYESIIV